MKPGQLPEAVREELRGCIPYVIEERGRVRVAVLVPAGRLVTLAFCADMISAHLVIFAILMLLEALTEGEDDEQGTATETR